jgi:DNA polymerase alpha subunit B
MDREIEEAEKVISQVAGIEVSPIQEESGSGAYYVGRIVKERTANKMTNLSMQLMGRKHQTIQLNIDQLLKQSRERRQDEDLASQPFSFFPGQIVCVRGLNDGRLLRVQSVLKTGIPFKKSLSVKIPSIIKGDEEAKGEDIIQGIKDAIDKGDDASSCEESIQVIIACGPFNKPTSKNNISQVSSYLSEKKPHVIILIGPFVDARDEKQILETDDDSFFTERMLSDIRTASPGTQIIVIPSQHDYNGVNVVPSPPLTVKDPTNVTCFPNPCFFRVNGVSFAVTSTDVIKNLVREEYSNGHASERMKTLVSHILDQKVMYPLFPPSLDTNVDFLKFQQLKIPEKPNVLITPSDLCAFCIEVDDTVCMNPRRLAHGFLSRIKIDSERIEGTPFIASCCAQVFKL